MMCKTKKNINLSDKYWKVQNFLSKDNQNPRMKN